MVHNPLPNSEHRNLDLALRIASVFDVPGHPVGMFPIGSGNINDTYIAVYRTSYSETRCVVQRVNTRVFRQPEALMGNYRLVTEHVHRKLERERAAADRIWQLPRMIRCKSGADLHLDDDGSCWRAITLIDSAVSYDQAQGVDHAREAGAVLGQFHRLVMGLDPGSLVETIPGFHHTPGYLTLFDRVFETETAQALIRADSTAQDGVRFVAERRGLCRILDDAKQRGEVSVRIMHGDPKINNILIDRVTGQGTSIIDLDTVGAGLVHWDFGDAVRSICNLAGEDAPDADKVEFSLDLCEAFASGYLAQAGCFLSAADKAYLYDSIRLITFELGLRFLQDHLAGNTYFKVRHPRHNLDRASVQFSLCSQVEKQEGAIRRLCEALAD